MNIAMTNIKQLTKMINTYITNNIEKLQAISINYINRYELGEEYDRFDLINHGYLKFADVQFNSESHFMGSFCKYMKLVCIGYRKQN